MTRLNCLALQHADLITDAAWEELAKSWKQLTRLSLTYALRLGDAGLGSLGRMPKLRYCFVSGSSLVTPAGMKALEQQVDHLEFRACRKCVR